MTQNLGSLFQNAAIPQSDRGPLLSTAMTVAWRSLKCDAKMGRYQHCYLPHRRLA